MPRSKNNLSISLPLDKIAQLERLAVNGESPSMVAKRLILESLSGVTSPINSTVTNDLEKILQEKISTLEIDTQDNTEAINELSDGFKALTEAFNAQRQQSAMAFEALKDQIADLYKELEARGSISPAANEPEPELSELEKEKQKRSKAFDLVERYLKSCRNPCMVKFLVKVGQDPQAIKTVLKNLPKSEQKEWEPYIIDAFTRHHDCFAVVDKRDYGILFWTGKDFSQQWQQARLFDTEAKAKGCMKRLSEKQGDYVTDLRYNSLDRLVEMGLIKI